MKSRKNPEILNPQTSQPPLTPGALRGQHFIAGDAMDSVVALTANHKTIFVPWLGFGSKRCHPEGAKPQGFFMVLVYFSDLTNRIFGGTQYF